MLDFKDRIDVELDADFGPGSDDNLDDHHLLTPTSSKTSKTNYIQKKQKKEQPLNQLAELRKSMQRIDKVIEKGSSTWMSKNRVSPLFGKERQSANAHQTKNFKSTSSRLDKSTHSQVGKQSQGNISRNDGIANQKNSSVKPTKTQASQSPFKNTHLKVDSSLENKSFKNGKLSNRNLNKSSLYYEKKGQDNNNNKRQGSYNQSQRSSDLSCSSFSQSQPSVKPTKNYRLIPVVKQQSNDIKKKRASETHQRTASTYKRSKSATSLKLKSQSNSNDSGSGSTTEDNNNVKSQTYNNKIHFKRKNSDKTTLNFQTATDLPNRLNADLDEKILSNLQSENLKLYFESRTRLTSICENFDFTIFQEVRNNQDSFSVFQRFCLMLLIIHGELERVQQERSDEYLKQLNVYQEIVNIKERIDENKYQIAELLPLYLTDAKFENNRLQEFINAVVTYAELRIKILHEEDTQKCLSSDTTSNLTGQFQSSDFSLKNKDFQSRTYKQPRPKSKAQPATTTVQKTVIDKKNETSKIVSPKSNKSQKSIKASKEYKRDASAKINTSKTPIQSSKSKANLQGSTHSQTKSKFIKLIRDQTSSKKSSTNNVNSSSSPKVKSQVEEYSPKSNKSFDSSPRLNFSPMNHSKEGSDEFPSPELRVYPHTQEETKYDQRRDAQLERVYELWVTVKNDLYEHEEEGSYLFPIYKCQVIPSSRNDSPQTYKSGSQSFRINLKKVETLQDSDEEEENRLSDLQINKKFTEQVRSQKYFQDDSLTRSSAFEKLEQVIQSNLTYNTSAERRIDMSIIERIKSLRSQSRENSDNLNKKRDDTIKHIQSQQLDSSQLGRNAKNDDCDKSQDENIV